MFKRAAVLVVLGLWTSGCTGSTGGADAGTADAGSTSGSVGFTLSLEPSPPPAAVQVTLGSGTPTLYREPDGGSAWAQAVGPGEFRIDTKQLNDGSGSAHFKLEKTSTSLTFTLDGTAASGGTTPASAQAGVHELTLCYVSPGASSVTFTFACTGQASASGSQSAAGIYADLGGTQKFCAHHAEVTGGASSGPTWDAQGGSLDVTADETGTACFQGAVDGLEIYATATAGGSGLDGNAAITGTVTITAAAH